MMTTNKLTKTFASGSLAIGVLAGAVLTATSASASGSPDGSVTLPWSTWVGGTHLVIPGNGARASYVPVFPDEDPFVAEAADTVTLFKTGDEYEFIYSAIDTSGGSPINNDRGILRYNIIFPTFVNGVAIDSDVTASGYGTVTKQGNPAFSRDLISLDGSADPATGFLDIPLTKALTITDTFDPRGGAGEGLSTLSNNFREAPHVPEPGTILGLLAVGGLGMVSRFKKQK